MVLPRWPWMIALAALAACAPPPAPPAPTQALAAPRGYALMRERPWPRLPLADARASTSGSMNGRWYGPERAIDDDPDTEWASLDTDPHAAFSAALPARSYVARVTTKTTPRSRFVIEVSDDGSRWTAATGTLTSNANWEREDHAVGAWARYLRVRFLRPAPRTLRHAALFDMVAYGDAHGGAGVGEAPSPGGGGGGGGGAGGGGGGDGFWFFGLDDDRVGPGPQATPSGAADGHFRVSLDLPAPREIRQMDLIEVSAENGSPTGKHWSTGRDRHWVLGVVPPGEAALMPKVATLGRFEAGTQTFELYAEDAGVFTGPNRRLRLDVTFGDGATRSFDLTIDGPTYGLTKGARARPGPATRGRTAP